jgi:ribosomal protein S18 acetylase RimI-like enzyme
MRATHIVDCAPRYRSAIRSILEHVGWAEQYITAAELNADIFPQNPDIYGCYIALVSELAVGFLYVQYYAWNQLAQIQGLAVDPAYHRQGIASQLVAKAEDFAGKKHARGIYVDTPTSNLRGRRFYDSVGYTLGYIMPQYYEANLDGVTYQKFFDT